MKDEFPMLKRQLTSNFDEVSNRDNNENELLPTASCIDLEVESNEPANTLKLKTGCATHIGGGHENQDKYFCFKAGENNEHLVMAVFDGHGRELGELAAVVARDYLSEELKKIEVLNALSANPKAIFKNLFDNAHLCVKEAFRQRVSAEEGWEVDETDSGYLVKRRATFEINVHGGTTATVMVIFDSERLLVANVGDSTALFGGINKKEGVLYKELSAEHSPESKPEFERIKIHNNSDNRSLVDIDRTTLKFVYDIIERTPMPTPKYSCPQIFSVNYSTGVCEKTDKTGSYYKNVRSEWATLVTTPSNAKFQDALAFTRSIGDFHLHLYGVSHVPDVFEYSLEDLHKQVSEDGNGTKNSVILLCTDGVWDNWQYHDILEYVMKPEVLTTAETDNLIAQKLSETMMSENLTKARNHFGSQADNMTGIVCLVSHES